MSTYTIEGQERMQLVIVGHVDHGKSTLVGRLLSDSGSLPEGKLEQVRRTCERNSKPFEYAFLLDALKDEQSQGITIDASRIFFTSEKRQYVIIDAPGHSEFLKNMISGAARAEAAILLIDALEGIAENSRRHAYMLSLLGIKQVVVAVNKMDLVEYDRERFSQIERDYRAFLGTIGVDPVAFVPVSAFFGVNLVKNSGTIPWYTGRSILEEIDTLEKKAPLAEQPLRLPVQDVYKFTANGDRRRIIAGTIETGTLHVGDEVLFLPSGKRSRISSIEAFNRPPRLSATAGEATGVTLETQVYLRPGEIMVHPETATLAVGSLFRANIFWMARKPLEAGKTYKLKLATAKVDVVVESVVSILNASTLEKQSRNTVERNEVAEVIIRTYEPLAFDLSHQAESTSRFVLVDEYDISGGGIIVEEAIEPQETCAERDISPFEIELNALVRKHYPHWNAIDITTLCKA